MRPVLEIFAGICGLTRVHMLAGPGESEVCPLHGPERGK